VGAFTLSNTQGEAITSAFDLSSTPLVERADLP